jgi:hypothetical protein
VKWFIDQFQWVNTDGYSAISVALEELAKYLLEFQDGLNGAEMPESQQTAYRHQGKPPGKRLDCVFTFHDPSCPFPGKPKIGVDYVGTNISATNANCTGDIMSVAGTSATNAEVAKKAKYTEYFKTDKGTFMPLGYEVYGALGMDFKKLTNLLAKTLTFNPEINSTYRFYGRIPVTAASHAAFLLRQRITIAIMRGNALVHEQYARRCLPPPVLGQAQRNLNIIGA